MKRARNPQVETLEGRALMTAAALLGPSQLVVAEGNSLTYGAGAANTATGSYPARLGAILGPSWRVLDLGVGGQTTEEMISNERATLAAINLARVQSRLTLRHAPIDLVWEGLNSIAVDQDTGAQAFNLLTQFIRDRQSEGFRVVVLTCLPADYRGLPLGFEIQRQVYNGLIRSGASGADAVVDIAQDPRLSDPHSTYYSDDHVHLSDSGYAVVASLVAPVVEQLSVARPPSRVATVSPIASRLGLRRLR